MGFVSVAELKAAQANVAAALQGQPPPSPPAPGQDHQARLEMYRAIAQLVGALGQVSDILNQLIEQQTIMFEEETKIRAPRAGTVVQSNVNKRNEQAARA